MLRRPTTELLECCQSPHHHHHHQQQQQQQQQYSVGLRRRGSWRVVAGGASTDDRQFPATVFSTAIVFVGGGSD